MGFAAKNIVNASIVENEVKHIRNINAIMNICVDHINKEVDRVGYSMRNLNQIILHLKKLPPN